MGLAQSTKMDGIKVHSGVAFLRPFKFFAEHHDAIRKSQAELEVWMHTGTPSKPGRRSQGQATGSLRETSTQHDSDDKNLVEDLKLLVHFLANDLKSTFDLRQKVKDGTALEIDYDDVWHLFARGDIVITPSDPIKLIESSIWRVVASHCSTKLGTREVTWRSLFLWTALF